jgi:hypothetical protein
MAEVSTLGAFRLARALPGPLRSPQASQARGVDPKGLTFTTERRVKKEGGKHGFADAWKNGFFGWEYKKKGADLNEAYNQLLQIQWGPREPALAGRLGHGPDRDPDSVYRLPDHEPCGTVPKPGKFGFSSLTLGSVLPGSS